jgi:hypothetical protein
VPVLGDPSPPPPKLDADAQDALARALKREAADLARLTLILGLKTPGGLLAAAIVSGLSAQAQQSLQDFRNSLLGPDDPKTGPLINLVDNTLANILGGSQGAPVHLGTLNAGAIGAAGEAKPHIQQLLNELAA